MLISRCSIYEPLMISDPAVFSGSDLFLDHDTVILEWENEEEKEKEVEVDKACSPSSPSYGSLVSSYPTMARA
jgi:hypothetical protein